MVIIQAYEEVYYMPFNIQVNRKHNPGKVGSPRRTAKALQDIIHIREQLTEAAKNSLRTESGLRETQNPMLTIPADLFRLRERERERERESNPYHLQEYTG